jgi:aminoglycoside 2'-N-acetyltransferase I
VADVRRGVRLRRLATAELTGDEVAAIRTLLTRAFGDDPEDRFDDADWDHALGGVHVVLDVDGEIAAHAAVVEREIRIAGRPLRAGYVEAVATVPERQGSGLGTIVMEAVNALIRDGYELGVLGTGSHHFYERLGWRTWQGPAFVRTDGGERRTPDEEGFLLVLATPSSPALDLAAPISCDWRPGDAW